MKIVKKTVPEERKQDAIGLMNRLRDGARVFGNPALGLKKTLASLEKQKENAIASLSDVDFGITDTSIDDNIAKVKSGIRGEETLAEYFEKIIKYDKILQDIVVFASVADPDQQVSDEYISDSDFIAIYGNSVIILDAKNIRTNPDNPIAITSDNFIINAVGGKEILEVHPSTFIWAKIFRKYGLDIDSISGATVIVNNQGATVWKNQDWYKSQCKPVHISDLVEFLHNWVKDKEPVFNLSVLLAVSDMQIREEKTFDFSDFRKTMRV